MRYWLFSGISGQTTPLRRRFPHAHAPNARSVHYQYFAPNKVALCQSPLWRDVVLDTLQQTAGTSKYAPSIPTRQIAVTSACMLQDFRHQVAFQTHISSTSIHAISTIIGRSRFVLAPCSLPGQHRPRAAYRNECFFKTARGGLEVGAIRFQKNPAPEIDPPPKTAVLKKVFARKLCSYLAV